MPRAEDLIQLDCMSHRLSRHQRLKPIVGRETAETKIVELPFGRLIDPVEAARAVNFMVSDDAGLMTGSVVNYDQSVWGAAESKPVPSGAMQVA